VITWHGSGQTHICIVNKAIRHLLSVSECTRMYLKWREDLTCERHWHVTDCPLQPTRYVTSSACHDCRGQDAAPTSKLVTTASTFCHIPQLSAQAHRYPHLSIPPPESGTKSSRIDSDSNEAAMSSEEGAAVPAQSKGSWSSFLKVRRHGEAGVEFRRDG
jgi:hypothetical protein